MKHRIILLILGGALLLCPTLSMAESYHLVNTNQANGRESRSGKCLLIVDLDDHTLTVPSLVVGCTLILKSENGEFYTYALTGTTFELPHELSGLFKVVLRNYDMMYEGTIEIVN